MGLGERRGDASFASTRLASFALLALPRRSPASDPPNMSESVPPQRKRLLCVMPKDRSPQIACDKRAELRCHNVNDPKMRSARPSIFGRVFKPEPKPIGPFLREKGPRGERNAVLMLEVWLELPGHHRGQKEPAEVRDRPFQIGAGTDAKPNHAAQRFRKRPGKRGTSFWLTLAPLILHPLGALAFVNQSLV